MKKIESKYKWLSLVAIFQIIYFFLTNVFDENKGARYNIYFGLLLVIMVGFIYMMTYKIFTLNGDTIGRTFIIFSLGWGIIMQLVMPPFSGTDEFAHFLSAYYASYKFYPEHSIEMEDILIIRESDEAWVELNVNFPEQYNIIMDKEYWMPVKENRYKLEESTFFKAWIRYIAAGFGIACARFLHLGMMPTIYIGRMMNLLVFIVVGYYLVEVLPRGKIQMMSLLALPLLMQQISTYSYDAYSITFGLLFVAQCIKCSDEKYFIKVYDIVIMLLSYVFLIPNKGVYVAFGLMIFIIPFKKWKNFLHRMLFTKRRRVTATILLVATIFISYKWILKWILTFLTLFTKTDSSIEQYSDMKSYTWDYAIGHPSDTLYLFGNTLRVKGWSGMLSMIGKTMGHHNLSIQIPTFLIVFILICVIVNVFVSSGKFLHWKKITWWILASLLTVALIWIGCMIRFTPISADSLQIAGRYYLPILAAGLIVLGKDGEVNEYNMSVLYLQNIVMMFICLYIINFLISI